MNSTQRRNNRETAKALRIYVRNQQGCERCGMKEAHFIVTGEPTLEEIVKARAEGRDTVDRKGFFTCPDLYGPDGRRLDMSDAPISPFTEAAAALGPVGAVYFGIDRAGHEVDQTAMVMAIVGADGVVTMSQVNEVPKELRPLAVAPGESALVRLS